MKEREKGYGGRGDKKKGGDRKDRECFVCKILHFFLFAREINTYWNVEPSD